MDEQLNILSRRQALKLGAMGASAAVLAACGSSSNGGRTSGGGSAQAVNLPRRLALPNASNAALFLLVTQAMQQGCNDRGLELVTSNFNNSAQTEVQQIEGFMQRGIGGLFAEPENIPATDPLLMQMLNKGIYVVAVGRAYGHTEINSNQYKLGASLGAAAVDWINKNLGGKAQVAYFNEDFLGPSVADRHRGALAALKQGGPGIQIVSDISAPLTTQLSANAMGTILQAHPGVDVVLGPTYTIAGVFAAYQSRGRAHDPKVYLSSYAGVDSDFDLIKQNTIYRATSAEPWSIWAYAVAQFAADWLEGKTVPQLIAAPKGIEPIITGPAAIRQYQAAFDDPRSVWADKAKLAQYVAFTGQISYATRSRYHRTSVTPGA